MSDCCLSAKVIDPSTGKPVGSVGPCVARQAHTLQRLAQTMAHTATLAGLEAVEGKLGEKIERETAALRELCATKAFADGLESAQVHMQETMESLQQVNG